MRIARPTLAALLLAFALVSGAGAAPPAPQFLPGQPMIVGRQVLLMWTPVPGAAAYQIYLNGKPLQRVPANQFLAPLPESSGQHRFEVSALDAQGGEGAHSEVGLVTVRLITRPKSLLAKPDPAQGTIGLLWDRVEGAAIYNIYRSRAGDTRQLLASVQEENYKDATVDVGVDYTYQVTAKDVSGIESAASEPARATLETRSEKGERTTTFRALPTREVLSLDAVSGSPLAQVSHLSVGPEGNIWVVAPKTRQIHLLDPAGLPVATFGPYNFSDTGFAFIPQKLDFGPKGKVYCTDAINSVLACIDMNGTFLWARGIITPPPQLKEVWQDCPEHMKSLPATPSSVLCLDKEIWVTDQRFQLLYRFDYEGNLLGYRTEYAVKGKATRLPNVGEIARVGDGRFLLTFPLAHRAAVVDAEFRAASELGLDVRGYIGGFVGIHGVQPLPEKRVLLTDPAVGSLQVFDATTGAYLYHLAGPEPRPDPAYPQRAELRLRKPNLAIRDREGRFWVYDAATKRIAVLKPAGAVTPELKP